MGAAMAGLPYVPLNYRLTDDQLSALIERIEPAFLITGVGDCQFDVETHMSREAFLHAAMATAPASRPGTKIQARLPYSSSRAAPRERQSSAAEA